MKKRNLYLGTVAAALMAASISMPATAAEAEAVDVAPDGTVATDPSFDGPHVTQVRVINEGQYLEIYWDRYVDELEAVDPENFTLTSGGEEVELKPKPETGPTDTIFFDRENQQIAQTEANSMARLDENLHLSSIAYAGSINPDAPLVLTIDGGAIVDHDGAAAKDAEYVGVPLSDFYTQEVTTGTGIVVKAGPRVEPHVLEMAAEQVDVELGRPETGIAARMAEYGCSLAVYGAYENAYMVPEHRGGYDPEMYDVEGYGGSTHNDCVSSISSRNVERTVDSDNAFDNTKYPNENILAHEFGHAVRLVGIETLEDRTLSDELWAVYENAYNTGLWPNTYAISNIDEYFATLTTIWFDNMEEMPDWSDGVRSPINTREELKAYDPRAYEFFAKIYDPVAMPAPWDEPGPDVHHGDFTQPPELPGRVTADEVDFGGDAFRIVTDSLGVEYQIDQYAGDGEHPDRDMVVWPKWGEGVWSIDYADGSYSITTRDGSAALTAISDEEVRYEGQSPSPDDAAQRWEFRPDVGTEANYYDGVFVNADNGLALTLDGRADTAQSLTLAEPEDATRWVVEDTTRTSAQGESAYILPVAVAFSSDGEETVRSSVAQQGFELPAIEAVAGNDWSRADAEFAGWRIIGDEDVLGDDWQIEDGRSGIELEAVWSERVAVAATRCLGPNAAVAVTATNTGDSATSIAVETEYGTRAFPRVQPGASKSTAFNAHESEIPAGEATVIVGGKETTASYEAVACG
ncbi:hypothetical protein [Microbacterium halophytorum]|uniref:hypothetical protein n=1 Tax=Microbacterium halophytorum TaxID=2067568 RepID=UPI000CFC4390|nr:hypothetical protein [Microbacterium halophytorum]